MPTPAGIDCVYLDTNVLTKAQWPKESIELDVFCFLAQLLDVDVCVSRGVDLERRRQWIEEMKGQIAAANKLKATCEQFPQLNISLGGFTVPDTNQLSKIYDELTEQLKLKLHIQTIPLTTRSSEELLNLAIHKKVAFEDYGKGFQDTLIYLSAVDHLKTIPKRLGAFVSSDGGFQKGGPAEFALSESIRLEIVPSLETLIARFRLGLANDPESLGQVDIHAAEHALKNYLPKLKRFVIEQLTPDIGQFSGPEEHAVLRDVIILNISNVQTRPPFTRTVGEKVRLSCDLSVRLHISSVFRRFDDKGRMIDADLTIEAQAKWNGKFYEEVELVGQLSKQLRTIAEEVDAFRSLACVISSREIMLRAEGYTELLGEVDLQVSGAVPQHCESVNVVVSLDTFASGRLDAAGFVDATLTSSSRGLLARGKYNNNGVVFEAISLGFGGDRIEESWTIKGLRGDASTTGVSRYDEVSSISAKVDIVTADSIRPRATIVSKQVKLGVIQLGVMPGVESIGSRLEDYNGTQYLHGSVVIRFKPRFASVFKSRDQESGDGVSPANHGTICVANLSSVPKGFRIFSTAREIHSNTESPIAIAVATDSAGIPQSVLSETSEFTWEGEPMVEVKPWRAAWEIVNSTNGANGSEIRFGLLIVGPVESGSPKVEVQLGLGPSYAATLRVRTVGSEFSIPRFQNLQAPIDLAFLK